MVSDVPHGFSPHTSGLLVPEHAARTRQVWTKDDAKILTRAAKLLNARGVSHQMRCANTSCPDPQLTEVRLAGRDVVLRCGCTDRHFTKAF